MHSAHIAIIGAGNMGGALLAGLVASGYPPQHIIVSNPTLEKLRHFEQHFGIAITQNNIAAANHADVIILCVEPTQVPIVAKEIAPIIQQNKPLIISIAAGVPETVIQQSLGGQAAIIRAMPNTPALVGASATALHASPLVTETQKNTTESIFRGIGTVVWLPHESDMDAVTALSGCGPAYFFLIIEILQQIGEQFGLPHDIAQILTLQTAYGAGKMALENKRSITELRKQVTSPGGSTEAALRVFETEPVREIFFKALSAACHRAEERSQLLLKAMEDSS